MRGSAVFRTGIAPGGALAGPWVRDPLWTRARAVPSLDLRFADNKSLVDATTGAQLVTFTRASTGTFVGSDGVIKTAVTDAPRFDHNPTTGESLGLLVEEQRTNLILQSENLSTTWTNVNTSEAINVATAPDGTTTADKLITSNGVAGVSSYITQTVVKSAAATTYTYSAFAKTGDAGTGTLQLLAVDTASSANNAASSFSTVSGTITVAASVNGTFTNASSIITPLADGWYRCSLTFTTGTETSINLRLYSRLPTTGDGTRGILLWGAQLEVGTFPTSYIPTTTATVTRAADVASITGTNFSSWYRQDEGTIFVEGATSASTASPILFQADDGTANERIQVRRNGTTNASSLLVTDGGTTQANFSVTGYNANTIGKTCAMYSLNDFQLSFNGTLGTADTSGTLPTVDRAFIGSASSPVYANGPIKRLTYWPTRLNEVLQRITQP